MDIIRWVLLWTIGLKPAVISRLHKITGEYYPGMFLPSILISMMNEVKRGYYEVATHNIKSDFSGQYTSLTIRSDVKTWLEDNHKRLGEDYKEYKTSSFAQFACVFMLNMFQSRSAQNYIVKLKESDFHWLEDEYKKRKIMVLISFEQFADMFLKEILERMNAAKEIFYFLTLPATSIRVSPDVRSFASNYGRMLNREYCSLCINLLYLYAYRRLDLPCRIHYLFE
jgi:hypothetical protein